MVLSGQRTVFIGQHAVSSAAITALKGPNFCLATMPSKSNSQTR